jgi:hypothetical protein
MNAAKWEEILVKQWIAPQWDDEVDERDRYSNFDGSPKNHREGTCQFEEGFSKPAYFHSWAFNGNYAIVINQDGTCEDVPMHRIKFIIPKTPFI